MRDHQYSRTLQLCVIEESSNGCYSDTICITIETNTTSINDNNYGIQIYPNPMTNYSFVKIENTSYFYYLTLLDTRGRILRHYTIENKTSLKIDKNELSKGLYYLRFSGDTENIYRSIVIK